MVLLQITAPLRVSLYKRNGSGQFVLEDSNANFWVFFLSPTEIILIYILRSPNFLESLSYNLFYNKILLNLHLKYLKYVSSSPFSFLVYNM